MLGELIGLAIIGLWLEPGQAPGLGSQQVQVLEQVLEQVQVLELEQVPE